MKKQKTTITKSFVDNNNKINTFDTVLQMLQTENFDDQDKIQNGRNKSVTKNCCQTFKLLKMSPTFLFQTVVVNINYNLHILMQNAALYVP